MYNQVIYWSEIFPAQCEKLDQGRDYSSPGWETMCAVILKHSDEFSYSVLRILRLRDETGRSKFMEQAEKKLYTCIYVDVSDSCIIHSCKLDYVWTCLLLQGETYTSLRPAYLPQTSSTD